MRVSWSQTLVKKGCTLGPIKMEYSLVTPSFQIFFRFFRFFYDALFLITNASEKEMHLSRFDFFGFFKILAVGAN